MRFFTPRNIAFSLLLAVGLTQLQYRGVAARHHRLATQGEVARGTSEYVEAAPSYARLRFVTTSGRTVETTPKCSRHDFEREYSPLLVIYNRQEPEEFDTLREFGEFGSRYRKFFYFVLYPLFLGPFMLLLLRNAVLFVRFVRAAPAQQGHRQR